MVLLPFWLLTLGVVGFMFFKVFVNCVSNLYLYSCCSVLVLLWIYILVFRHHFDVVVSITKLVMSCRWDGFWLSFSMMCWYRLRSGTQFAKPLKTTDFIMGVHVSLQETWFVDNVHIFFHYQFWHCLLMTFGIDDGFILEHCWRHFHVFRDR